MVGDVQTSSKMDCGPIQAHTTVVYPTQPKMDEEKQPGFWSRLNKGHAAGFFATGLLFGVVALVIIYAILHSTSGLYIGFSDSVTTAHLENCAKAIKVANDTYGSLEVPVAMAYTQENLALNSTLQQCQAELAEKTRQDYCVRKEHHDIVGYDLEWRYSPLEDCCKLCEKHPVCEGWAWESGEGGRCYLKSRSGPFIHKENVWAGVVPTTKILYDVPTKEQLIGFCTAQNATEHQRDAITEALYNALYANSDSHGEHRDPEAVCCLVAEGLADPVYGLGGTWGCVMGFSYASVLPAHNDVFMSFKLNSHEIIQIVYEKPPTV